MFAICSTLGPLIVFVLLTLLVLLVYVPMLKSTVCTKDFLFLSTTIPIPIPIVALLQVVALVLCSVGLLGVVGWLVG